MSERFSLAWVLCGDISRSSSTVVSLCGPHPVSVSVSFSVRPVPVDRSPLLLWPLLALLELPHRSSIHLRPVPPLLLAVALRRHFPSGVLCCSPRGPGPVLRPPGVWRLSPSKFDFFFYFIQWKPTDIWPRDRCGRAQLGFTPVVRK